MHPVIKPVMGTGSNATYVYLGFCPDLVRIYNYTAKVVGVWHRVLGNDANLVATPTETDDSGWVPAAASDEGIKLVQFGEPGVDLDSAPSVVTDPNEADGIQITSDWGGSTGISDKDVMIVEAFPQMTPFVRAVHDGGAVAYLVDDSLDFKELGVSGGQLWIAINVTKGSYAYVGEIQKDSFSDTRYNKCTLTDAGGDAITTNMADDDVIWLMPKDEAQYPLSDIGIFS